MADVTNPLNPADLDQINAALDHAKRVEEAIKTAARAGIDLSAQRQELQANVDRLQKIKQVYFPGQ